ncbi:MAG: transcriptional repressor [Lachnospiraceae bacterium]|jgi:Fe2+ or Zn2+ uptake regulation protein|nr:transcriptional repressor [Lachnospiraceae bacterium]NBH27584.1 transcriptional repressor [Lachnospiraceae bacterium]GFI16935.1 peroxide operon regulator [Lachnospiraceae bacterium]
MTKNAGYILEIINNSTDHLTAEQIYLLLKEKNKSVVQATVYNNLSSLYQQGMIRKISAVGYPDRYDKMVQHDHLFCRKCGKLLDICLEDLTETIQKQVGVPMISYDLKINYICEECLKKENGGDES